MKRCLFLLLVLLCFLSAVPGYAQEPESPAPTGESPDGEALIVRNLSPVTPETMLTMTSEDGKHSAILDWSSGVLVYRGDMPVDESAQIFFDAVMRRMDAACAQQERKQK